MLNNNGFQNELDFVNLFNNKYLNELDNNSKNFLLDLFDNNINNDFPIKCWKNKANQKTDIFIKFNNNIKSISLKCGNCNSIHSETIEYFKLFLEKLRVPYSTISYYVSYHYGYKRNENGNLDFSKTLSSSEYKELYQSEIDIFNKEINKANIIIEMVKRFIIRGNNSEYDIDALITGTVDDYLWIKTNDLYELILSNRNINYTSPHIGNLTIGPKNRNLDYNPKNASKRYLISVRWTDIRKDILEFRKRINN